MSKKEILINLCKHYDYIVTDNIYEYDSPLGLGDILNILLCIKNNLIENLYINLYIFEIYYKNGENYLEFRLQLINDILKSNNIIKDKIKIYYNKECGLNKNFDNIIPFNKIKSFKLNFNMNNLTIENIKEYYSEINFDLNNKINANVENLINGNYIIFHTKCRFFEDPEKMLFDLKIFYKYLNTIKTNYTIIILGENQNNYENIEVKYSSAIIIQIYDILKSLKNNNNVIDLTAEMYIDNLNYSNFLKDIKLIENAKYNIHFGGGGSLCFALSFAKHSTIIYNNDVIKIGLNSSFFIDENTFIYDNIDNFLNKLSKEIVNEYNTRPFEIKTKELIILYNHINNKIFNNNNINKYIYQNIYKDNKNVFYVCHGGLGDIFNNFGAIHFLSYFYKKVYLFCPSLSIDNLKLMFYNIENIIFLPFGNWHDKIKGLQEDFYINIVPILYNFLNNNCNDNFDWKQYISYYRDLSHIDNQADALHHWINFGKFENRNFDWKKYTSYYSDLSYIDNQADALHHWINFGKFENRIFFEKSFKKNIDINYSNIDINLIEKDIEYDFLRSGHIFVNENFKIYISEDIYLKYNKYQFNAKLTNNKLIDYLTNNKIENNDCIIHWDLIKEHYSILNLPYSIYFNYFYINSSYKSIDLYLKIKDYKIVFLHFISSHGQTKIPENEWPHIYNEEYLIINPDKNHYNEIDNPVKYNLANQYLNLLVLDYIEILYNATNIYICDSCFASLTYPLMKTNRLNAEKYIVYDRHYPNSFASTPVPINLSK
jgi:hypothetical protein